VFSHADCLAVCLEELFHDHLLFVCQSILQTAACIVGSRSVRVGFVVDEVGVGQVFLLVLWLSRTLHQIFILFVCLSLLTFMEPCIFNVFLSTTNKMQRYTIFFIVVNALHISSGFFAYHQELKNCTCSIGYLSNLFAATANLGESEVWQVSDAACTVFELLMMSGKTARNM